VTAPQSSRYLVTAALPQRFGIDAIEWLALGYPVLIGFGYLFKPTLTDPAVLWPAHAASLIAYLLLRYRYWPLVMLVTTVWELLSVPFVSVLTGGHGFGLLTTLGLSCANIISVVVPALLARLLRVVNTDGYPMPLPSPLWLLIFLIGIVPGAMLGTWVHSTVAGPPMTALAVTVWTLATALGIVTFAPTLAVAIGLTADQAPAPAGRIEALGVGACIVLVFLWRGFVPWRDLARVPSLTLLALPITWVALRFSQRTTALLVSALVTAISLVGLYGFGSFKPVQTYGAWQDPVVTSQLFFLTVFGAALLVNRMTVGQRALAERLKDDRDRLSWYAGALDAADEAARKRTAAALHDGLGQVLTGQAFLLRALRKRLGDAAPADLLGELDRSTGEAQDQVRNLIGDLSPPDLETAALRDVLERLARSFEARYGFHVTVRVEDESGIARSHYGLVYRVVRELVFNAFKHSGQARAEVRIAAQAHAAVIAVSDAGVGFDATAVGRRAGGSGFGLTHLSECILGVGGTIEFGRVEPQGSRVVVTLPRPVHPGAPGPA